MPRFFKTPSEITNWLKLHHIRKYSLVYDQIHGHVVDLLQNVDLSGKNLHFIPVKFNIAHASFDCSANLLSSLDFCPHTVKQYFNCSQNKLESLEGGPSFVKGRYICSQNQLKNLKFLASHIGSSLDCSSNLLTSLEGCPPIGGFLQCSNNLLTNLKGCPSVITGELYCSNNHLQSLEGCPTQAELIMIRNNPALGLIQDKTNLEELLKFKTYQKLHDTLKKSDTIEKKIKL